MMKVNVLTLAMTIGGSAAQCAPGVGTYLSPIDDCQAYVHCRDGVMIANSDITFCPGGTLFSQELQYCDYEANVDCGLSPNPPPTTTPAPSMEPPPGSSTPSPSTAGVSETPSPTDGPVPATPAPSPNTDTPSPTGTPPLIININWQQQTYEPISFGVGSQITFTFFGNHNLWLFNNVNAFNSCNFSPASEISVSSITIQFNNVGVFYYGCQVGTHCSSSGQKIQVTVTA